MNVYLTKYEFGQIFIFRLNFDKLSRTSFKYEEIVDKYLNFVDKLTTENFRSQILFALLDILILSLLLDINKIST